MGKFTSVMTENITEHRLKGYFTFEMKGTAYPGEAYILARRSGLWMW